MKSQSDSNLILETNYQEIIVLLAGALLGVAAGAVLVGVGIKFGWVVGVLAVGGFAYMIIRKLSFSSTLLLTPGGFTFRSNGYSLSYRWSDIEAFYVTGTPFSRTVHFELSSAARAQLAGRQFTMESSMTAADENYFVENYGIGASNFCSLLNEWRIRYSNRNTRMAMSNSL